MLFKYKCRWKSICGEAQWPTWVPVPWTRGFVEGPHVGGSRGQVHAREFGSYKEHGVMRADSIRNALVCSATVAQKTGAVEHLHRIRIPHIIGASQVLFRPKWWDVRITKQNQSEGTCPIPATAEALIHSVVTFCRSILFTNLFSLSLLQLARSYWIILMTFQNRKRGVPNDSGTFQNQKRGVPKDSNRFQPISSQILKLRKGAFQK